MKRIQQKERREKHYAVIEENREGSERRQAGAVPEEAQQEMAYRVPPPGAEKTPVAPLRSPEEMQSMTRARREVKPCEAMYLPKAAAQCVGCDTPGERGAVAR
jgi:hypothetical protein